MNAFYQNEFLKSWPLFNDANESDTWRELEKHAPSMPSRSDMLRRVARDPMGQAMVFDVMVKLFLEHVLGATSTCGASKFADGLPLMVVGVFSAPCRRILAPWRLRVVEVFMPISKCGSRIQ